MSSSSTLPESWLETLASIDWSAFRTPEAFEELLTTLNTFGPTNRIDIPLTYLEDGGEGLVLVLQGTDLQINPDAFIESAGNLNESISGIVRRIKLENDPDPNPKPELVLNNLPLADLFSVVLADLTDEDGVIGEPTISLINSKLYIPTTFAPVSLGEAGDAVANGDFFAIGSNPALIDYFQKFVTGSGLNDGVVSTDTLSINLDSIELLGYAGTNAINQSLSGFDHLNLPNADQPGAGDVMLPNGGLFLTTGGGVYPFTNTRSSFTVGRGQPGLDVLTTFAQQAYPGAGSTRDATVLKFSFTPEEGVKSLILDLVFASDEYPEYANSSYVDIGAIWFDNQLDETGAPVYANYATFDNKPLSVVTDAITDPRFINNNIQSSLSPLPIEFDGITKALKIGIPLDGLTANEDGSYTINIGIADSGDTALDSALWISNLVTDQSSIGGTFLPVTIEEGAEYIAPPDIPVYATLAPFSTFKPSKKPDFAILPPGQSTIKGTGEQLNGDQYQGAGNETEIIVEEELTEEEILIELGSAVITLDTNKDGVFDENDPKFSLIGDYFDIEEFEVTTGAGQTVITYSGPTGAETDPPVLSISGPTDGQPEGYLGSSSVFSFTIIRTGDISLGSSVAWAVEGSGDAAADANDFEGEVLPSGTAVFEPGEDSKTIEVTVAGDVLQEVDEEFSVVLAEPTGASLSPEASSAIGVIINDDQLGTAGADQLKGTVLDEFMDGRKGQDKITGEQGADLFGFRFKESNFLTPDIVTDFRIGEDKIVLLTEEGAALAAPTKFSRARNLKKVQSLSDLGEAVFADADGKRGRNQALGANQAALVVAQKSPVAGTYLLINDSIPGFNARNDLLINITGFSGKLPKLGSSSVDALFTPSLTDLA
jgi:hypothetical protein